jgi:hypothetical protein
LVDEFCPIDYFRRQRVDYNKEMEKGWHQWRTSEIWWFW